MGLGPIVCVYIYIYIKKIILLFSKSLFISICMVRYIRTFFELVAFSSTIVEDSHHSWNLAFHLPHFYFFFGYTLFLVLNNHFPGSCIAPSKKLSPKISPSNKTTQLASRHKKLISKGIIKYSHEKCKTLIRSFQSNEPHWPVARLTYIGLSSLILFSWLHKPIVSARFPSFRGDLIGIQTLHPEFSL